MKNFYKNKKILVTGGAGSIGSEITKHLLKYNPKALRLFDNNETGLFDLAEELQSDKIRVFVGDIRDKERLRRAMEGVDFVFHAAALKHVVLCEYNPFEAIQVNVLGTQNVINTAIDARVQKVINISTDKAVNPINVMGATKLLAEKLTTAANYYKGRSKPIFSSVRFGNVLNSRGSVISILDKQIKRGGSVTLTNPKMTRFAMSIPKAVDLVLKSAKMAEGEEIFIFEMPALLIGDLFEVAIGEIAPRYNKNPKDINIKIIGQRPGEKFHEEVMTEKEAETAYKIGDIFVISPEIKKRNTKSSLKKNYCSKDVPLLNKKEIKKLLKEVLIT